MEKYTKRKGDMEGVLIYDPRNDSMVQRYKYLEDDVLAERTGEV